MKTNLISFTAVLALAGILFSGSANAQTSDDVTFKLILNPIQSITVNTGFENTSITYNSIDNYKNGVFADVKKQLNVFSTHGFQVLAIATDFTSDGTTNGDLGINSINVIVSNNGVASLPGGIQLSKTATPLFSSNEATKSTAGLDLDVKYTGAKDFFYAERKFFSPISAGSNSPVTTTHTTTVTYSIVAL